MFLRFLFTSHCTSSICWPGVLTPEADTAQDSAGPLLPPQFVALFFFFPLPNQYMPGRSADT